MSRLIFNGKILMINGYHIVKETINNTINMFVDNDYVEDYFE